MNTSTEQLWQGFAVSVPGSGHIRREIPCQDASNVILHPRAALIVCDGKGSAKLSHFGAQKAVRAFRTQCAIMEPFLVNILDREESTEEQWVKFCQIMYRTLVQAKLELSEEYSEPEKEFDFTVAFAVTGSCHIGTFQVGDGAIVLRQDGVCQTVFVPEKGEFANQTSFLRSGGEEKCQFQSKLFPTAANSGIAATSDGPEHLMFKLPEMLPGKIFDAMFDDMKKDELCRQDLLDFLTNRKWNDDPRGTDDRSLALLVLCREEGAIEVEEEEFSESEKVISDPEDEVFPAKEELSPKKETSAYPHCTKGRKMIKSCKKKLLNTLLLSAIAAVLCVGAEKVRESANEYKGKILFLEQENSRIRKELRILHARIDRTLISFRNLPIRQTLFLQRQFQK